MKLSIEVPNSWPLTVHLPADPSATALLMIDFQGDFCSESASFIAAMGAKDIITPAALPQAKAVLAAARHVGIRIIHTLEAHRQDLSDLSKSKDYRSRPDPQTPVIGEDGGNGRMLTRGSACNGLMSEVAFVDGEIAIHKPGKGAFYDTELLARLNGVSHLLFAGVTTECCVQTTMREANDRGFHCLIIEDATASVVPEFHNQTVQQVTAYGSIVGSAAKSSDVIEALVNLRTLGYSATTPIPRSMPVESFPVINVSPLLQKLSQPFSAARRAVDAECLEVAAKIDRACREAGFFYVTGHGLRPPFERAHQLFDLGVAAKMNLQAEAGEGAGYEPSGAQVLDEGRLGKGIDGMVKFGDLKESYIIGKSAPSQRTDASSHVEGRWPPEGSGSSQHHVEQGFRDDLLEYHDACDRFLRTILRGCALGLGLAADTFDCSTTDAMTKLRLLRYPSPSCDPSYDKGAHGCGAHQDWGALTLLAQDNVGGLEVFCNGAWLPAPHIEGTLLINVGDMMGVWTNGRYRSAPHRVVKPNRERHSIAFFYNCDSEAPIDPRLLMPNMVVDGPTGSSGQCKTAEEYILERVKETYVHS